MPNKKPIPIEINNLQKRHPLQIQLLKKQTAQAVQLLPKPLPHSISSIHIHLITPHQIARLHHQYCGDPSTTDVITFQHGEIFISPHIANQQRHEEKLSLHLEILTYIIHALLHLCGYNDLTKKDFLAMRRLQSTIRNQITSKKITP